MTVQQKSVMGASPSKRNLEKIKHVAVVSYTVLRKFGPAVMGIAALAVSLFSISDGKRTQAFVARTEALNLEYEIYRQMATLEHDNPLLSHLFAVSPASYYDRKKLIGVGITGMTVSERAKLLLQERALALYIFTAYEETYFHWDSAVKNDDKNLSSLLMANLVALNDTLCNSRLLWYWENPEDPLKLYFSSDIGEYYKNTIGKNCHFTPDPQGPIPLPPYEQLRVQ